MTMTVRAQSRCVLRTTECWDKLRDLSLAKDYVPGVTDIEFVSQNRTGLGASRIAHSKLATLHETVVEWNEGRGFLLRLHRGDKPPRPWKNASFRYAIEPDGVATLIDLSMTYTFGFGPLAPLLERLARRPLQRNLDRLAARLARYWETGSAEE